MIDLNVYSKPNVTEQLSFEWKTNGKTKGKLMAKQLLKAFTRACTL